MTSKIESIRKHVEILNHEVGVLQTDVKWIKKIMIYIAAVITSSIIGLLINAFQLKGG